MATTPGLHIGYQRIKPLTEHNMHSWYAEMIGVLVNQNLWDIPNDRPLADNASQVKAKFLLLANVDETLKQYVRTAATYDAALTTLRSICSQNLPMHVMHLEQEANHLKQKDGEKVSTYVHRCHDLFLRLAGMGQTVRDDKVISQILLGLRPEFSLIRTCITANRAGYPTVASILAMLSTHELQNDKDKANIALYGNHMGGNRSNDRSGDCGDTDNDNDSGDYCEFCRIDGHDIKHCRKLARALGTQPGLSNTLQPTGQRPPGRYALFARTVPVLQHCP